MVVPGRTAIALPLAAFFLIAAAGCGRTATEEDAWRREVDGAAAALEETASLRYRIHLETWIGVPGQNVYGDERGEGAYVDGDYSASFTRSSPAGEENLVFASSAGFLYQRDGDAWNVISTHEAPSPLYDPTTLTELISSYNAVSYQGEEDRSGTACRRYLLRLEGDSARDAMPELAWSYFSDLRFELSCTVWASDASRPPASLRLEIIGLDVQESVERYRVLATLDLFDFDSPDIELALPGNESSGP
jgi:hypothetical protein